MFKQIIVGVGLIALGVISVCSLDAARTASKRLETDGLRAARLGEPDREFDFLRPHSGLPSLAKAPRLGSGR